MGRFWHRHPSRDWNTRWHMFTDNKVCECVVAMFVFGPQLCLDRASHSIVVDGRKVPLCTKHYEHLKEVDEG